VKEAKNADKVGRSKFGKICKDPDQKIGNKEVWWSKDTANHGGASYKLFEEKADHFSWIGDVDKTGKVVLKHKSEIGVRIWKKDINWIK
jgi:hypothetical protein